MTSSDRHHVLVVDDDASIREALGSILEEEGYSVAVAADGREALAAARAQTPAVILLDLMMPFMTGWEVADALGADPALRRVPVCVLSAYADRAPARSAAVLRKPLDLEWLLEVVARLSAPS